MQGTWFAVLGLLGLLGISTDGTIAICGVSKFGWIVCLSKSTFSKSKTRTDSIADKRKNCNLEGSCNKGCIVKDKCDEQPVLYKAAVYVNSNGIYKRAYVYITVGKLKDQISKHYTDIKYER